MKRPTPKPPLYLTLAQCAELLGVHRDTARRWAEDAGVLLKMHKGRLRVSVAKLRDEFPDVFQRVVDEAYEGAD